jgi:hypothetical protein
VQAIVALLWKFLSEPKREQAAQALVAANPYLRTRFIRGTKGRSLLSMDQAMALRRDYDVLRQNRKRAPRGALKALRERYDLNSVNTLACIVQGRGYANQ